MKLALCQLRVTENKADNLRRCREMLYKAADGGAKMALLPEMFTIAYVTSLFSRAAESCPNGETGLMLQDVAKETGMFIIGGSIPEIENGLLYNTSMSFSSDGAFEGKYLSLIHISEPTRLLSISYAVFCLKKKIHN